MNIPGFIAEASLYKPGKLYELRTSPMDGASVQEVVPQFQPGVYTRSTRSLGPIGKIHCSTYPIPKIECYAGIGCVIVGYYYYTVCSYY